MKIKITFLSALLITSLNIVAQNAGQLDASFGTGGKVIVNQYPQQELYDIAIQSDGKIVAVGRIFDVDNFSFCIMRFNNNGTPDTTFANNGIITVDINGTSGFDSASSVVIQPDGKIVVGGRAGISGSSNGSYFGLIRLTTNGVLDTTFGTNGKTSFPVGNSNDEINIINKLALQPDGKIIAVGTTRNNTTYNDFAIARLNTDGSLDVDFSNDGKATVNFNSDISSELALNIKVESDGKILVAGTVSSDLASVRFYDYGSIDTTYGTLGKIVTDISNPNFSFIMTAVAFQDDSKILVLGTNINDIAIVRINGDGSSDTSFGIAGKMITDVDNNSVDDGSTGLLIQPDGKIIATALCSTGGTRYFTTLRYTTLGILDTSFSNDGKVLTNMALGFNTATGAILQQDGKLVIGGFAGETSQTDFALARYGTGLLNTSSFENQQILIYPNPSCDIITIQKDLIGLENATYSVVDQLGKIILKGKLDNTNQINISGLKTGVYFIKIVNETFRIIKS